MSDLDARTSKLEEYSSEENYITPSDSPISSNQGSPPRPLPRNLSLSSNSQETLTSASTPQPLPRNLSPSSNSQIAVTSVSSPQVLPRNLSPNPGFVLFPTKQEVDDNSYSSDSESGNTTENLDRQIKGRKHSLIRNLAASNTSERPTVNGNSSEEEINIEKHDGKYVDKHQIKCLKNFPKFDSDSEDDNALNSEISNNLQEKSECIEIDALDKEQSRKQTSKISKEREGDMSSDYRNYMEASKPYKSEDEGPKHMARRNVVQESSDAEEDNSSNLSPLNGRMDEYQNRKRRDFQEFEDDITYGRKGEPVKSDNYSNPSRQNILQYDGEVRSYLDDNDVFKSRSTEISSKSTYEDHIQAPNKTRNTRERTEPLPRNRAQRQRNVSTSSDEDDIDVKLRNASYHQRHSDNEGSLKYNAKEENYFEKISHSDHDGNYSHRGKDRDDYSPRREKVDTTPRRREMNYTQMRETKEDTTPRRRQDNYDLRSRDNSYSPNRDSGDYTHTKKDEEIPVEMKKHNYRPMGRDTEEQTSGMKYERNYDYGREGGKYQEQERNDDHVGKKTDVDDYHMKKEMRYTTTKREKDHDSNYSPRGKDEDDYSPTREKVGTTPRRRDMNYTQMRETMEDTTPRRRQENYDLRSRDNSYSPNRDSGDYTHTKKYEDVDDYPMKKEKRNYTTIEREKESDDNYNPRNRDNYDYASQSRHKEAPRRQEENHTQRRRAEDHFSHSNYDSIREQDFDIPEEAHRRQEEYHTPRRRAEDRFSHSNNDSIGREQDFDIPETAYRRQEGNHTPRRRTEDNLSHNKNDKIRREQDFHVPEEARRMQEGNYTPSKRADDNFSHANNDKIREQELDNPDYPRSESRSDGNFAPRMKQKDSYPPERLDRDTESLRNRPRAQHHYGNRGHRNRYDEDELINSFEGMYIDERQHSKARNSRNKDRNIPSDDEYSNVVYDDRLSEYNRKCPKSKQHGVGSQFQDYRDPSYSDQRPAKFKAGNLVSLILDEQNYQVPITKLMKKGLDSSVITKIVHKNSILFEEANGVVYFRPKIDLCKANMNRGCRNLTSCNALHLCYNYIVNNCPKRRCELGHDLHNKHNGIILELFHLSSVTTDKVHEILNLSITPSVPNNNLKICHFYLGGNCTHKYCNYLHICQSLSFHICTNKNCDLDHNILSKHNRRVLERFQIDTNESPRDVIRSLQDKYPSIFKHRQNEVDHQNTQQPVNSQRNPRNHTRTRDTSPQNRPVPSRRNLSPMSRVDFTSRGKPSAQALAFHGGNTSSKRSEASVWAFDYDGNIQIPEICYYSVTGKCRNEDMGCQRLHSDLHYHWQVKVRNVGWVNLRKSQVQALERAYIVADNENVKIPPCDPSNCPRELMVLLGKDTWEGQFTAMVLVNPKAKITLDLRRLCSENVDGKVEASWNLWYFLDQNDVWVQYGKTDTTKRDFLVSNITTDDIENHYQQNPRSVPMVFKNKMFTYTLDFNAMTQTNQSTGVKRKVRRRPVPHIKNSLFRKYMPTISWS